MFLNFEYSVLRLTEFRVSVSRLHSFRIISYIEHDNVGSTIIRVVVYRTGFHFSQPDAQ